MATSYLPDPATRLHGVWIHRMLCVRRGARAVRTWVTETIRGWGLEIMGMVGRGGVVWQQNRIAHRTRTGMVAWT